MHTRWSRLNSVCCLPGFVGFLSFLFGLGKIFYWSQAAKANAALMGGNYKKVVAVRRHNLRMQLRGQAAMAGTGQAAWPAALHDEGAGGAQGDGI